MREMGFASSVIDKAYASSEIKTTEGVLNYIDAHPELQSSGAMEEETLPGSQAQKDVSSQPRNPFEDEPEESKPQPEQGSERQNNPGEIQAPISSYINAAHRETLLSMGYTLHPVEKALLLTGNKSVEAAMDWLDQNKDQPDFEEQMFIAAPDPNAESINGIKRSNLTPEEARAKAKELQNMLRAKRAQKEEELEKQREADRLRGGKDMSEAMRKIKEQQVRLDIDYLKREKAEQEAARKKILDEIAKDKMERTGKPTVVKLRPVKEVVDEIYTKMRKVYPKGSGTGEQVNVCLKTVTIYLGKFLLTPA